MHTDNCARQYKCRQNFFKLTTFGERHPGSIAVHKFAQKFKFKGPWDATGKIVKQAIKNCELQLKCCLNAIDCYDNIRERLAQDGSGKKQNQWKKWELEKNEEILTKRVFRTNRTFIGLAAETKEEYDELVASGREHVVFTNREHVPDMKAIPGTQKIYQATGICVGEKTLTTAELQCSCGPCRSNPGNTETCLYKDERGEIKKHTVRAVETDQNDPHGIKSMKVAELKEELRARNLQVNGVKVVLIEQLTTSLESDDTAVNY